MKRFFYEWISYPSYGGGGYWKFKKQKMYNCIMAAAIIIFGVLAIIF